MRLRYVMIEIQLFEKKRNIDRNKVVGFLLVGVLFSMEGWDYV